MGEGNAMTRTPGGSNLVACFPAAAVLDYSVYYAVNVVHWL